MLTIYKNKVVTGLERFAHILVLYDEWLCYKHVNVGVTS